MDTSLIKEIKKVLKAFPEYWEEETLLKNRVIEDLREYKNDLIEALLANEIIRKTYAIETKSGTVFKLDEFIGMLRYRNYWENSYTQYSNEIGLTSEGKYLRYNSDVVVDFPHKDCVLEGGMTKEDTGRSEIYYHKILAREEIDLLLSPKVLANMKKYDKNGEHKVLEFNDTDNLIIKGNNLVALHTLKERFAGKVKLIYIDPPYYFKQNKEKDAFAYNSNFKLSTWLTFMKNRLEIAKELLQEGGTIWISINEDGMHYLKVLADSIFGMEYFLGTTPRRTRDGKSDVPYNFSQDFDWLLAYSNVSSENKVIGREVERKYYETPDYPGRPWRLADLTKQTKARERKNSYFTMVDPKNGKEYPASEKRTWAITKDTFDYYYTKGYIVFPDDYDFLNISKPYARKFKDEDLKSGKKSSVISDFLMKDFLKDLLTNSKNSAGNKEIEDLKLKGEFNYPKPENLLKSIIEVTTEENDIVLDFFMGSATTQAVAMKMNRRFIGIEQMDYIETVSVPRLKKVIEGEQGGISKDVNWSGGGSFVYAELYPLNQKYINEITQIQTETEIEDKIEKLKNSAFLDFKVKLEKLTTNEEKFKSLSLEEKKQILIEVLDVNQLYLSYSEIDDSFYEIDEDTKKFNHSFYQNDEAVNQDE
jgi:adenine-specific DNA-methyltransferase